MDLLARQATPTDTPPSEPVADEEFYSSWSLFLVCVLLIISLWTSYYLQIKRIRAVHETLVSIAAGMFVGFIVRLAPGQMIREMLVRSLHYQKLKHSVTQFIDLSSYHLLQLALASYHFKLRI